MSFRKASYEATVGERKSELTEKASQLKKVLETTSKKFPDRVETEKRENTLKIEIETLREQIVCMERT